MRIQDIIRSMVDMIDHMQDSTPEVSTKIIVAHPTDAIEPGGDSSGEDSPLTHAGDDINRWRQIVDLADNGQPTQYANTPKEQYADIDAVTVDAGGGVNGPKHPHDLRGNSFPIYKSGE